VIEFYLDSTGFILFTLCVNYRLSLIIAKCLEYVKTTKDNPFNPTILKGVSITFIIHVHKSFYL
jgi:hypothetical protein